MRTSGLKRLVAVAEERAANFPGRRPSVGLVLVGWDATRAQEAVDRVNRWRSSSAADVVSATLVLNQPMDLRSIDAWETVRGSNIASEFSGFDEGRAHGLRSAKPPELWLFMNDRFFSYDVENLGFMSRAVLDVVARKPMLVGHVDLLSTRVGRDGPLLQDYIRSNFLAASEATVGRLPRFATFASDDAADLFPRQWPGEGWDRTEGYFDPHYLERLRGWLTGADTPRDWRWYRATSDPAEFPMLRQKAVSIVNEHLLSLFLDLEGVCIVDVRRLWRYVGLSRDQDAFDRLVEQWRSGPSRCDSPLERAGVLASVMRAGLRRRGSRSGV